MNLNFNIKDMDKQDLFRNFDEEVFKALTSLNSLLQTIVVSRDTKAIMKINRFRCWLMDYQGGATIKFNNLNSKQHEHICK